MSYFDEHDPRVRRPNSERVMLAAITRQDTEVRALGPLVVHVGAYVVEHNGERVRIRSIHGLVILSERKP